MKNDKIIRKIAIGVFIVSLFGILFSLYSNFMQDHAGDKIPEANIKKQVYKNFDNYDFINLKSLNVSSIATNKEEMKIYYNGDNNLTFKLVDVYNHNIVKEFKSSKNAIVIKSKDVKNLTSRYDLLTTIKGEVTKLDLIHEQISLNHGFGIIDNEGLELSFNKIVVDEEQEFKLFVDDINYYRKSIDKKPLNVDSKINKLSKVRTNDEVENKTYNFHYSKSTGFSNAALINAGVVKSECGSKVNIKDNKYCNITYKQKKFSVNIHNNDFEQITRGILFAHSNLEALKNSPIHNRDIISEQKETIGGAMSSDKKSYLLEKEPITMYGPKQDHTESQAASAYINNNFSNGIKKPQDQEQYPVEFLNTALSFYLI